jgi:imidazolonepropionase-like amidohydrolase
MPPAEALAAVTATSAAFLHLAGNGTLDAGKNADFIVLDANPLDNIANTRKIADVYKRGEKLDRAALRASFK